MKNTRKRLASIFWAIPVAGLAIALLFESETVMPGWMAGAADAEYIALSLMVLVTLGAIPSALRLFKTANVGTELTARKEAALLKWGTVRLGMLGAPFVVDTILYYMFMKPAFSYLAIILLICLIFVYPSEDRCASEVENLTDGE